MWRILAKSTLIVGSAQEKFNKDGAQATFAAITDQARQFHDRDLYLSVLDCDCVVQTHAARMDLVGESPWEFRDQNEAYRARGKGGLMKWASLFLLALILSLPSWDRVASQTPAPRAQIRERVNENVRPHGNQTPPFSSCPRHFGGGQRRK